MTRLLARASIACLLVVVLAAPSQATVLIGADLAQIARTARLVVRGRVVDATGRWTPDHRTIETLVTLEAEAYLKGTLGDTITFVVPGGRLGRYRNIVVGAPTFTVGDRVVVFLGARGPGVPFLVGLGQGVYRVVPAADGRGTVVTPPAVLPTAGAPSRVTRGDPARRPLPMEAFDALVRELVEGQP
jgi:hypothetical protein